MDSNKNVNPRGRPRKWALPPVVPEFPSSHLTVDQIKELQLGYKILKDILQCQKISSLLEKPDESLFGLHDYYSVVEKPMWIKEISRKFADSEYSGLKDVIDDITLLLQNVKKFCGETQTHMLIKQASRVEKILKKHASEWPKHLKSLCFSEASKPDTKFESENDSFCEEFKSKIEIPKQNCNEESSEIAKWEEEVLMNKQNSEEINHNADLAEIGQFLRLAKDPLCLKEFTQFEIERMLFISKESTTLATIMTSLLCPTFLRGTQLYFKPIMVYEVWHTFLFKKMEQWYSLFAKKDRHQMFSQYGIEPRFWDVVGEKNPMEERNFDELQFVQKACILKTLCSRMFDSYQKIEDYFNSVEADSLRTPLLYQDAEYKYVSMFSPEIRVYRYPKDNFYMDECTKANVADSEIEAAEPDIALKKMNSQRYTFSLIASDKESLLSFIKRMNKKKRSCDAIKSLLKNDQTDFCAKKGLKIMFDQWKNFAKRPSSHAANSIRYWIEKDTKLEDRKVVNTFENPEPVLGRRVVKPKFSLDDDDSSSNDETMSEESGSDWEDGNIRQHKKVKRVKTHARVSDSRFMKLYREVEEFKNSPLKTTPSPQTTTTPKPTAAPQTTPALQTTLSLQTPFNGRPRAQKNSASIIHCDKIVQEPLTLNDLSGALAIDIKKKAVFTIPSKEEPKPLDKNSLETLVISLKTGVVETRKSYDPSNDKPEFATQEEFKPEPFALADLFPLYDQQPAEVQSENPALPEPLEPFELDQLMSAENEFEDLNFTMI